jgi:5-methylcytosine-specific restriction endonuclease McrA
MPRRRPSREIWDVLRRKVWKRDGGRCVRCSVPLGFDRFHCDHIRSGKLGTNSLNNLRTLCRRCHVLRACHRHQGMISAALRDGIIEPDWRKHVWDD